MKIIIYVDFSGKDFNKDFALSNSLTNEHTVLLVTNMEQLHNSMGAYDLILRGFSSTEDLSDLGREVIELTSEESIEILNKRLKG